MVTARLHPRPAGLPEAVKWCGWCGVAYAKGLGHKCPTSTPAPRPAASGGKRPKAGSDTEALLAAQLAAAGFFDTTHRERPDGIDPRDCFRREAPWGLLLSPERGFRGDVLFLACGVKAEVVGGAHAAGRKKVKSDVERDGLSASVGLRSVPVSPESVRDGSAVALIARALQAAKGGG